MTMIRIATCLLALGALGACASGGQRPPELSQQQACLAHYEKNQMERDRCALNPSASHGPVPDARPQDLPIKTGGITD